jgi:Tol biopolymer transport system component
MKWIFHAVALTVVVAGATAAIATSAPAPSGRIVFTRYRLQNAPLWSEIWVARPDGTGARKVSHAPKAVEDDQAHWSPDGRWIVFARCTANGPCSVWIVRPDGSGQRRLSTPCASPGRADVCSDDSSPSFTPDGRHVVFQHEFGHVRQAALGDQIEHSQIVRTDLDGGHQTILRRLDAYRGDLMSPRVSPDGRRLLFALFNAIGGSTRPAGGQAVYVTDLAGSAPRRVTPWKLAAAGADWSPNGGRILFASTLPGGELTPGNGLYTVRADGSRLTRITTVDQRSYILGGSFAPDGRSVVFATDAGAAANPHGSTFADIVTMPLGSHALTYVTRTPNLDGWPSWGSRGTR